MKFLEQCRITTKLGKQIIREVGVHKSGFLEVPTYFATAIADQTKHQAMGTANNASFIDLPHDCWCDEWVRLYKQC